MLENILSAGYAERVDILVVNDASTDGTAEVVRTFDEVRMITHVFNLGYGSSLQTGYRYAMDGGYRYVLQMDADGQHDVCNIQILMDALKKPDKNKVLPDIVIGSRFVDGSRSFAIPVVKKLSIGFFRALIRATTGKRVLDPTSGLQGLDRKAFSYYAGFGNFDNDYPDANMIIQMLMMGYEIAEVPSVMHERVTGVSMHSGIIKPLLYMLMMPLNIFAVYVRLIGQRRKKRAAAAKSEIKDEEKVSV